VSPGECVETARAATRVARESYGKLVAFLAARDRDVAAAEDALADAFEAALQTWPQSGPPDNPEGWLVVTARRRLADAARRRRNAHEVEPALGLLAEELGERESLPDRRLALMFACAHPGVDEAIRAPLMLQCVLGLDAADIASAFLVSPTAMGQRLSRAKAKIRLSGVPFRIPEPELWPERLDAVLQAIYACFSHGWAAFGDDAGGRALSEEAIWLGRVVVQSAPDDPEAKGLLALMLYADSRRAARRDAAGHYAPLALQDVSRWNWAEIDEAENWLRAASRLRRPGRFQIEAAIQSVHAARRVTGSTDWAAVVELYDALLALTGSRVVAVNRAVAVAGRHGPLEGLRALVQAGEGGGLETFQAYWAAKAAFEAQLGINEADVSYARAIGLETDPTVRAFLSERRAEARRRRTTC
jgi:RNA polymerase sigma-70 factor (ECF subfamily)